MGDQPPPLVTAIVTGHTVYFSTTLKGGGSLQYVPNQNCPYKATWIPGNQIPRSDCALVSKALQACRLLASNHSGHRTSGNCGKITAAMAFCTVDPNGSLVGAKAVTLGEVENVQSVLDPCEKHKNDLSSAPTWGCLSFTRQLGMIDREGHKSLSLDNPSFYSHLFCIDLTNIVATGMTTAL